MHYVIKLICNYTSNLILGSCSYHNPFSSKPCEQFTWVHVNDAKTCVWHKRFWTYFQLDECLNKVSMQKKELHSQAHRSNASFKKNSTRQILLSDIMCVFSTEIRLLIILLSGWFFFKKGTWWHWSANKPFNFLLAGKTSLPSIQNDSHKIPTPPLSSLSIRGEGEGGGQTRRKRMTEAVRGRTSN